MLISYLDQAWPISPIKTESTNASPGVNGLNILTGRIFPFPIMQLMSDGDFFVLTGYDISWQMVTNQDKLEQLERLRS